MEEGKEDEVDKDKMDKGLEELEKEKEKVREKRKKFFSSWQGCLIKYAIICFAIFIIFIGSIFIYTGNWPSMVVVESNSMQHSDDEAFLGVIDTGDMVLVKSIEDVDDVVSYMKGKRIGHETYGEYGDVVIYRKNGYTDTTPVIHRAIIWLEFNETSNTFNIPELKNHDTGVDRDWYVVGGENRWYDLTGTVVLRDIGYDHEDVSIDLGIIILSFTSQGVEPHSGFITLGDHNRGAYDQGNLDDGHGGRVRPVLPEWIEGKARGEFPGLGLVKLQSQDPDILEHAPSNSWIMFLISSMLINAIFFGIPIFIFIMEMWLKKRRSKRRLDEREEEGKETDRELEAEEEEPILHEDLEEKEQPPPKDEP